MDIKELYQLYQQHPCITTDSRDCPEGSIFLALKGESFNGNQFAVQALEKGCAYAIVDEDISEGNPLPPSSPLLPRIIRVDDCLQTFKDLAREHRRQFNIPVVAITGTNGKTTTKELVAAVLSEQYNVLYTQGNFNNDVGVPKTLFRLNKEHDIAVVEMGASHPGDIKTLVETTEPTCGLITMASVSVIPNFSALYFLTGARVDFIERYFTSSGTLETICTIPCSSQNINELTTVSTGKFRIDAILSAELSALNGIEQRYNPKI